MPVDTSIAPYYDDYSEEKNFHRILFKPGVAVQARELTQSQTILQTQIKRVGDYLFTNGDKVTGPKPSINLNARHVKIQNLDILGREINVENFLNKYVVTNANDVIGLVESVYPADIPNAGDPNSFVMTLKRYNAEDNGDFPSLSELYFYTNYSDALNRITPEFTALVNSDITVNVFASIPSFEKEILLSQASNLIRVGDELQAEGLDKKIYVTDVLSQREIVLSESLGFNIDNDRISFVRKACNPTSVLTQDSAVFYKDGFLIKSLLQSIVPDTATSFPSRYIGYFYSQRVVESNEDTSLLDPAVGSSNYFAPGADRLQINLVLSSVPLNADGDPDTREDFLPIVKMVRGEIEYIKEISGYSELDRKLAERTYDESGSYVVDQFNFIPVETTSESNVIIFSISPGKAYVGGYQVQTVSPSIIEIPKNTATENIERYNINTTQGNYYKIEDVKGSLFPIDNQTQGYSFLEAHSVENPINSNTKLGDIEVRNLEFDSINGDTLVYKLFFNQFAPIEQVPLDWPTWAARYKIDEIEGRRLSNLLYETNTELPYASGPKAVEYTPPNGAPVTIGTSSGVRFYALNREPDSQGLAFWYKRWEEASFDITQISADFISAAIQNSFTGGPDTLERLTSNTKTKITIINNSPFYNGVVNPQDIKSFVGVQNSFTSHVNSSSYANPAFRANVSQFGRLGETAVLFDKKDSDSLIFRTNKDFVKNITNISTEYQKTTTSASFTGGVYTKSFSPPESFALGDGNIPPSTARIYITMVVKSGATGSVPLGAWAFESGSVLVSGSSLSVRIDTGDASFNGTADINFRIENDNIIPRQKTLIKNQIALLNMDRADKDYTLGVADISDFNGIFKLGNVNNYAGDWQPGITYSYNQFVTYLGVPYISTAFTTNVFVNFANAWTKVDPEPTVLYVLDDGQRDNRYDHGSVRYVGSGVPGNVLVSYNYYTHSGEGPVTVDSYPDYETIGSYRSVTTSRDFNLRDCIDFRPVRQNTPYKDYSQAIFPVSSVNTEVDIEYYLGRYDKIYVSNRNENFNSPFNRFSVEIGVQNKNPEEPIDESDLTRLALATLEIPPFCVSAFDVKIAFEDNKRYTMKDIGRIEDLAIRLDQTVRLQNIEINLLRNIITNEDGDILLKSGILVEDFSSLEKSELATGYFSCAIDEGERECFPMFAAYNIDLFPENAGSVFQFADIVTKKYEEEIFVSNLEGNNIVNVNPGAVDDGKGRAITTKRNSFSLNLLSTGGNLIVGSIATKTLLAYFGNQTLSATGDLMTRLAKGSFSNYATQAAFQGENILSIAWGAARDLGFDFYNAVTSIDGLTKFVTDSLSPYFDIASAVYNWASKGISTLIGGTSASTAGVSAAGSAVAGAEVVAATGSSTFAGSMSAIFSQGATTFGQGLSTLSQSLSYALEGQFSASLSSLQAGFTTMAYAITSATLSAAAAAASSLAASLAGVPILGTAAAGLSAGIAAGSAYILASPVLTVIAAVVIVVAAVKLVKKLISGVKKFFKKLFCDERMKEDIKFVKKMDNGLNLYSYKYKDEFQDVAGKGYRYGYIASEVEKLYPKAVSIADNGYKIVDYSKIRKA